MKAACCDTAYFKSGLTSFGTVGVEGNVHSAEEKHGEDVMMHLETCCMEREVYAGLIRQQEQTFHMEDSELDFAARVLGG